MEWDLRIRKKKWNKDLKNEDDEERRNKGNLKVISYIGK